MKTENWVMKTVDICLLGFAESTTQEQIDDWAEYARDLPEQDRLFRAYEDALDRLKGRTSGNMKYFMRIEHYTAREPLIECQSATFLGAKMEATHKLGGKKFVPAGDIISLWYGRDADHAEKVAQKDPTVKRWSLYYG